ncbi:MAG: Gfo/Idh/MocA family oxidoreductase [Armatimonadetes bacterium]|nr:Gfo/Idh/MocA family oxidoreductase [Armatimonadota bacterium]
MNSNARETVRGKVKTMKVKTIRWAFAGVGGRGRGLMRTTLGMGGVEARAVYDPNPDNLLRALDVAEEALGKRPEGYSAGPDAYERLLARDDVDAVLIASPVPLHAPMATAALRAGKHVLSEVGAAVTIEQCWDLVHAAEESQRIYMLAENACYIRNNLVILEMVRKGVFGDLTYAEGGYVHDLRSGLFRADGSLTWRGELAQNAGNWYPTHPMGPVSQWLGVNRGDRLVSLVSLSSREAGASHLARQKLGVEKAAGLGFANDSNNTLIRTAKGALIDLRFDVSSARPCLSTMHLTLQGTTASYDSRDANSKIWIEGRTEGHTWEPLSEYAEEFEPALWRKWGEEAKKTGHGGADFFSISEFLDVVRTGRPSPIDAVDAATWSCITPLSAASAAAGGQPREIPDFTQGSWNKRRD